ncbi:MAG: hypothetical protein OXO49_08380 [Gammaproteobacteria bacterium]|nr:hypothetical protein [Gammaproteobacteria bacterium]MDE0252960.1 hypothetical protein [Gammaproteobacteria bacterium]MDE0403643.1 hypothetical protein [Gammaproteobacteria bacterium]
MLKKPSSSTRFPEFGSILLGAGVATITLLGVYFLTPLGTINNTLTKSSTENSLEKTVQREQLSPPTLQDSGEIPETHYLDFDLDLTDIRTFEDVLIHYSSPFDRFYVLYHLAGRLSETELKNLVNEVRDFEFDIENEHWKQISSRILLSRYVLLNPVDAGSQFLTLDDSSQWYVAYVLFNEWTKTELQNAIDVSKRIENYSVRGSAIRGILDDHLTLPKDELKDLAAQLGSQAENYLIQHFGDDFYADEETNPADSWNKIVADPTRLTYDNRVRIGLIVEAWVKADGVKVLDDIIAVISDNRLRDRVLEVGLKTAAEIDPSVALDFAVNECYYTTDFSGQNLYNSSCVRTVIKVWSANDPIAALEHISTYESKPDRYVLANSLCSNWSQIDNTTMLSSIDKIPDEYKDMARVLSIRSLTIESIEEAVFLLHDIQDTELKFSTAKYLAHKWADDDVDAALHWAATDPTLELVRDQINWEILSSLTHSEPKKAFELAIELPLIGEIDQVVGLEARILEQMSSSNLDLALELLPKVRAGKTKLLAYHEIRNWLLRDGRIDKAVEIGGDLPEDDQIIYYTSSGWSVSLLESVENVISDIIEPLPTKKARSRIALRAIELHIKSETWKEEEIEELKEYLTVEDLRKLEDEN